MDFQDSELCVFIASARRKGLPDCVGKVTLCVCARAMDVPAPSATTHVRVCVTGATGYLAGHIIDQLLAKGYAVNATMRNLKVRRWWAAATQKRRALTLSIARTSNACRISAVMAGA